MIHNSMSAMDESRWRQVLARDAAAAFFYAVTSTGIFCRPGCPSRRPARAHVRFFEDADAARAAGFRACLRCQPEGPAPAASLVAQACAYLRRRQDRRVPLAELGRVTGASPFTVQRVFAKVMGVSPQTYANTLRAEAFRAELATGAAVTEAVYAAGFSAPSRAAHAAPLGMAARVLRAQGTSERIGFAVGRALSAALGRVLVAVTGRGICAVLLGDDPAELAAELARRFAAAEIVEDRALRPVLEAVLSTLGEHPAACTLPLDLRGTAFQARVWAALQAIPAGETRTYAQLAAAVGNPKAVRAVAAACGANPVAVLVPCHRVVGSDGRLTGYRWGLGRKRALLEQEAAR